MIEDEIYYKEVVSETRIKDRGEGSLKVKGGIKLFNYTAYKMVLLSFMLCISYRIPPLMRY